MPGKRCPTGNGRLRLNAALNAILIRELMDGPCTANDLCRVTGIGHRTVTSYLLAMKRKNCIRIAAWERDTSGKQSIRVFGFGDSPDAPKQPTPREVGHQRRMARDTFRIITRMAA